MQLSVETKIKKSLSGEAGHGNNELCAGQATKNVLVDCSAEPVGAHWDRMIAKTRNIEWNIFIHSKTQTCMKRRKCNCLWKLKQNSLCGEAGKAICKLRVDQVTKNCVGGSSWRYCCVPSKTSHEWEINHYALLRALYAIHHVNESVLSDVFKLKQK